MTLEANEIQLFDVDESWRDHLAHSWGEKAARHLHFEDGFTICAMYKDQSVGVISAYWRDLPPPIDNEREAYIDFLEVHFNFRRRGIAKQLINLTLQRAREHKVYQVRSWSSEDKAEAIPMWKSLGFGLCPVTTFPRGKEVHGFFVTMVFDDEYHTAA